MKDICDTMSKIGGMESLTDSERMAIISHYVHNQELPLKLPYWVIAQKLITEKVGMESTTSGRVEDPMASYSLFPELYRVPFPPPEKFNFTFIDLFAGIGGFRIPLQKSGGRCVFSSEFNTHAQNVYQENYGETPFGDITKIPMDYIPEHDVLTAGFPCQPFSISGKMKGFEDTRGTLIYNVFKIIEAKQPKVVFLENVKHLVYHDGGRTLRTILDGLNNSSFASEIKHK